MVTLLLANIEMEVGVQSCIGGTGNFWGSDLAHNMRITHFLLHNVGYTNTIRNHRHSPPRGGQSGGSLKN